MKGLHLLSFSTPTTLFSLYNQEVVPVVGILYDTRLIYESTVQGIFHGVVRLTVKWGALHFGPGKGCLHLHDHQAFIKSLGFWEKVAWRNRPSIKVAC